MKTRHLILMLLLASGGTILTKKKIQKELYFLALIARKDLKYRAHYYGPYSSEVEEGLDELIGAGFVNVKEEVFGIDSSRGFEFKRFDFSLTKSGGKLAKILANKNLEVYQTIEGFINNLKELGDPDYLSLSLAAKAHFILSKEGKSMKRSEIGDKAKEFGWNVNDNDIDTAISILKKMGFVKEE